MLTPSETMLRDLRRIPRRAPFHIHEISEVRGSSGWLIDLTPSGARLELTRSPEEGERMRIWIELPDHVGTIPRLRGLGVVKWTKAGRRPGTFEVGIAFDGPLELPDEMFWTA